MRQGAHMIAMRRPISRGWLVGLYLAIPIMAWASPDALVSKDEQFLRMAAGAQKAEVALSQLALERAESEKVKQFAQRMMDEHTKAGQELRKLAEAAGVVFPDEPATDAQKTGDTFSKLVGKEFDRAYVAHEVKDHQKTLTEFKKQTKTLKHPQVKQWAAGAIPVLKEHLIIAKNVSRSLRNGTNPRRK